MHLRFPDFLRKGAWQFSAEVYCVSNALPLKGIRVLDLSGLLPGPLLTLYLSDLGAEIWKLEHPRLGDGGRHLFKKITNSTSYFEMLHRNKKGITLHWKKPETFPILKKLLGAVDVLVEGFRPGTLEEAGLGREFLLDSFPRLVFASLTGYGKEGKDSKFAGHDLNYMALSGNLHQTSRMAKPVGFQMADVSGSLHALSGILALLYQREKTSRGGEVQISMALSAIPFQILNYGAFVGAGLEPIPEEGLLDGGLPNYMTYQTKDGRHVALGTLEEPFFRAFVHLAGLKDQLEYLPLEKQNFPKIKSILKEYFQSNTLEDLKPLFESSEACLTPVLSPSEVVEQRSGMDFFKQNDNLYFRTNLGLNQSQDEFCKAPMLGENNLEVYTTIGFSKEEIENWKEKKWI